MDAGKACFCMSTAMQPCTHSHCVAAQLCSGPAVRSSLESFVAAEVPRLAASCMVPACMNKLPVAGQNAHKAAGPDPQETPTPLHTLQNKRTPLQVYETNKPFFGSAPVGGLDILCSESLSCKPSTFHDSIHDDDNEDSNNANRHAGSEIGKTVATTGDDSTLCDDTD